MCHVSEQAIMLVNESLPFVSVLLLSRHVSD